MAHLLFFFRIFQSATVSVTLLPWPWAVDSKITSFARRLFCTGMGRESCVVRPQHLWTVRRCITWQTMWYDLCALQWCKFCLVDAKFGKRYAFTQGTFKLSYTAEHRR